MPDDENAASSGEHSVPTLIEHDAATTDLGPALHRPTPEQSDGALLVLKKSHIVWLIGLATSLPGGAAALTSYMGGAQSEAETQKVVQMAVDDAVERVEQKINDRVRELQRDMTDAKKENDDQLDNIEEDLGELKLDMRDLKRDVAEVKVQRDR